jgi:hypothetical protein
LRDGRASRASLVPITVRADQTIDDKVLDA